MSTTDEHYIGLMTGTSMDAVDAVLVRFTSGTPGVTLIATASQPIPTALRRELLAVDQHSTIALISELDARLGALFGDAVNHLLATASVPSDAVTAIGSHGQTVLHLPDADWPRSVQLGDPNRIAEMTGITTVADFRRRDIAAGGQGAPLAPAFHHALFGRPDEDRIIVNIGGMANLTVLLAGAPTASLGFDTGPGNVLMDAWCRQHRGTDYDDNGDWARSAAPDAALLNRLLDDAWFDLSPPKSTGRDQFNQRWLTERLREHPASAATVQSTLCELTALSIARAILRWTPARTTPARIVLCGGGANNATLLERLGQHLPGSPIDRSDVHGIGVTWVEAVGFAWLAKARIEQTPTSLPDTTGARHANVLGGIYPGLHR